MLTCMRIERINMNGFTPATFQQEIRYQQACDLLGGLISLRAAWIHEERKKPIPDQAKIEKWLDEQNEYGDVRDALDASDDDQVESVFARYEAQEKAEAAAFEEHLKTGRSQ